MGLDVYSRQDIARSIVAGLVLAVETAEAQGLENPDFIAGSVSLAKHQALTFGIPWSETMQEARATLGARYTGILEHAIHRLIE